MNSACSSCGLPYSSAGRPGRYILRGTERDQLCWACMAHWAPVLDEPIVSSRYEFPQQLDLDSYPPPLGV